ncbi:hypothetical protein EZV62_008081 [Acer yangbiense]|uniref:RNase H type-1 domain-containing protein n=1 Tax=Acer yangbiense TaxID=1000413 RepID=A0A5C7IEH0_9ROSI|nr:hypothetical protein EZV62_008081 [Acer yangbiense]
MGVDDLCIEELISEVNHEAAESLVAMEAAVVGADALERRVNGRGTLNIAGGRTGLGVVIRDCSGFVLASCSLNMSAGFDATLAETMAIFRGLIFIRDRGLAPCCLESDVAVVSVSHVPRLANNVAHGLAKYALKVVDDLFWIEDYPPCVRKVV